ncbi:translation elongation factor G [Candidatus Curtissbacteria bacterium RIFCSPHIGHO2_01_FULL_41_44]|uniref:Elongation factor G n=1 Tax=Candidatus Curtissbacteria bacterium RIFCSPLOWO2_01_FULL_42_50 TaxID=1797730 RepID=A0A1F5H2R9_9BACT|nr:MAG: translation elongation factor G [Candidatus Curtissbacteria bacterium RIFCSPHIGHO2_02_FULL_42_58]OGD94774.1 MAG: translation elongation factor G [Candidatus Curtissbacteria bacterium RIFCSPHIGHO2_01_FULL_41_44]OGD96318.1 MAG: translation elongation factor G [Candidatus Curtissbacteria bacterium RIFCSPHIGHO2_12_FULL_42_33]OGD98337.1 MAG: translation elongation factor G [Candidatus Curtissbacteria bacterium RIFCSPLOWO2_01_FULL_42_50]OGE10747.1 MAG: translation elongation factor G [Candida
MATNKSRLYPLEQIRNIGIIAHIDAGKTTTTERILYYTGRTYKLGNIDEGTTVTDWMAQEKERGITIVSAAITTFWTPKQGPFANIPARINLIDTPGHVDFTAEVERSLRVLDGGVTVLDAEEGVQSQSETVWRQADKYKVPRICFVNKMDKIGADFFATLASIKKRLGAPAYPINLPLGAESDFKGIIDLFDQKAYVWDETDPYGAKFVETPIPPTEKEKVEKYRHELIEKIVETDEALLVKYLAQEELDINDLKKALRRAVIDYKIVPVMAGSSLRNKGVQPLLDAVVQYLPSPVDIEKVEGINPKTNQKEIRKQVIEAPFAALAFKIQVDPHVGKLTYLRVYSGKLKSGTSVANSVKNDQERISRILLMHANAREEIPEAYAGEIIVVVGLKNTATGDTLCDGLAPIILESISFPEPVISLAIEPQTKADQEKLGYALSRLSEEDPTFRIKSDLETGQTIISGMGELHLEILVDRMHREFRVAANVGSPQVAYRETIKNTATAEGKYIRQTGGHGQYGHCFLRVEPMGRGEGFQFVSEIRGGAIPQEFISSIQKGVREKMDIGVLAGYPIVDMKVAVYDGSYHDVDSSDIAFKIAGSLALEEAVKRANLCLLEPIMKVEVTIPEEFMGDVIGDLSAKRAQILSSGHRANSVIITALVPLSEMSGYVTTLRSMTQGRGSAYMEPSHYEEVPQNIADKIVAKVKGNVKES